MTEGKNIMVEKLQGKINLLLPGRNRISTPNIPYTVKSKWDQMEGGTGWRHCGQTLLKPLQRELGGTFYTS